jgi:hypothetical protein
LIYRRARNEVDTEILQRASTHKPMARDDNGTNHAVIDVFHGLLPSADAICLASGLVSVRIFLKSDSTL